MSKKTKKRSSKRNGFTLPLAIVAGFMPLATNVISVSSQGWEPMSWMATQAITGYDTRTKKWWSGNLMKGTVPIILGMLAHKIIGGKLGVNRSLAAAGIPFIRL
jgi:hypothetical protein